MRYLVLSDVHGNLEALEAVLSDAPAHDAVLVLGDLVGYGADPNAVIARVRDLTPAAIVRGNHDKVGAGVEGVESFNHLARRAITWTSAVLTPEHRSWLAAVQAGPVLVDEIIEICHGAPQDEDEYIVDALDAGRALDAMRRPLCLFGHTHVPAIFVRASPGSPVMVGSVTDSMELTGTTCLVNCGAVGQPRDGDARAAYGFVDTVQRQLSIRRVPYDVTAAQRKILAAGLPDVLAQRLALGR